MNGFSRRDFGRLVGTGVAAATPLKERTRSRIGSYSAHVD